MNLEDLTPEQQERARSARSPEEVLALAKEAGYELTDEQLDAVSGGDSWACWDVQGCTDVCTRY